MTTVSLPLNNIAGVAAFHAFAITPSDGTLLPQTTTGIWIGGAGNIAVLLAGDTSPVTLTAPQVGIVHRLCCQKVMATGTTATLIIGLV